MQVPTAVKLTAPPETEHTDELEESTVTVTGRPEVEVALGVYVGPPTVAFVGAGEVKEMAWIPLPTGKLCCTWGAGRVVCVAGLVGIDRAGAHGGEAHGPA